MLGALEKFMALTNLVSENEKIDDHKSMHKIFHLSATLIVNDSDIDKAFGSMHQKVMENIKKSLSKH